MKKTASLMLALLVATSVTLAGCGADNTKNESKNNAATNQSSEQKEDKKEDENKSEFKYYTAEELKKAIENNDKVVMLDIQVEEEFNEHHIKGVIPTHAYPVKTDEDKAKLDKVLDKLNESKDPIVIVCPGGAGGAERTYGYLKEKGIDEGRLFILKDGQKNWPYDELLEK
ncbi:rhodanese-like domain-containing protein [Clostridium senegalense]|uniref:rhodanese-like domain-containing protein n=1 Tax=Clostridium senegalense TaxID=1465809 RepID=UPI000289BFC3|nr:rhodanese-like domain-containing protein [Clostridium senegalense]